MAQSSLINEAAVSLVVAVAQRGQVTADQRLTSHNGTLSLSNSGVWDDRRIIQSILGVGTERVVNSSPQAPAVTGIRLSSVQNNITASYTSTLNLNVQFLLVLTGNLNNQSDQ